MMNDGDHEEIEDGEDDFSPPSVPAELSERGLRGECMCAQRDLIADMCVGEVSDARLRKDARFVVETHERIKKLWE